MRERDEDRERDVPDEDRARVVVGRLREAVLGPDELRELVAVLPRELVDVFRPFEVVCRDFVVLPAPFLDVLFDRLDVRRLLVLGFACAISFLRFARESVPGGSPLTQPHPRETTVRPGPPAGRAEIEAMEWPRPIARDSGPEEGSRDAEQGT